MLLIIAPHPDDDIICCGNIIYKNPGNVKVIFITDGSKGSPKPEEWGKQLALKRVNEAYNALSILGLKNKENIIFLNNEDGEVARNRSKIYQQLLDILQKNNIKAIYFPSPFDMHQDHSEIGKIILSMVNNLKGLDLYMYTVHQLRPLPRSLSDAHKLISKLKIRFSWKYTCFKVDNPILKKRALEEHKSQIWYISEKVKKLAIKDFECFYFKHI